MLKILESRLGCKEIKPVNPKGNQPWIFIRRTDAEAEAPILWPPDAKSRPIIKDSDAGKDWRQEEKGTTEDEMVGWHHRLNGHEFEQAPGDGEGQGSLVWCSPWGRRESDTTAQLNSSNNKIRPTWFQTPLQQHATCPLSVVCPPPFRCPHPPPVLLPASGGVPCHPCRTPAQLGQAVEKFSTSRLWKHVTT